ncbi:hypothetical protein [Roseivivax isoporae]|uniref:Glycosyltransferase 2-like domain-containing protein n=1 Tax=Roseivivax isoporae LMG 25204 TaxID=1449351 RepID=X7F4A0_9RHOB|nr:hypothetical protein [Roseivivax isoporae]ETX27533.1 hypothetical protein RISW2_13475 [Roseivivax isoporae LMG 25204]
MAQEPATPKTRRLLARTVAALAGPGAAGRLGGLAASERAALELRAARRGVPARPAEEVVFLIPLVGAHHVGDWKAVTARLAATLESFVAQDDGRWRAVVCCQDRPPLPADPRIAHLPFDDPTPGNDKWRKLGALTGGLGDVRRPAYVMSFDADDLLRQGTVAEMLRRQAPGGYLAETGFVRDAATGDVALAGPPTPALPLRKPFWKLCGSCAALRHDPDLPESAAFLAAMTQHEHRMFPHLAALAGLGLVPLSRPSVLYELNHGENFGVRRGRVGFKTRFVQRFRVSDPDILAGLDRDFPQPSWAASLSPRGAP